MRKMIFTGLVLVLASVAYAQSSEFSYQGSLTQNGSPANGNFYLEFTLFDAAAGGNQVGSANVRSNVTVTAGTFSVSLDFGANAFPGAPRFLAIAAGAQCPSPPCTVENLTPRTPLLSAPYAFRARTVTGPITANSSTAALAITNDHATGAALSVEALNGGPIIRGLSNDPSTGNPKFIVTSVGQVRANGSVFARSFQANSGFFGVGESGNMNVASIDAGSVTTSGNTSVGGLLSAGSLSVGQGGTVTGLLTTQQINSTGIGVEGNLSLSGNLSVGGGVTAGDSGFSLLRIGVQSGGDVHLCMSSSGTNYIRNCSSSLRYKDQVSPFAGGLQLVKRLQPIAFRWRENGQSSFGLGAEDVEQVDPRLAYRNDAGAVEGVRYDQVTTLLINSVKQQQEMIDRQQKQIDSLTRQVRRLTKARGRAGKR